MITCKICGESFETAKQLSWHIKHHNLTNVTYYDTYLKREGEGICKCCGNPTKFISLNQGYNSRCSKKCQYADKTIQEKRLATHLRVHGYKTSFCTRETQDKVKQTFIENYGVNNPFKSKEIQEKIKQANIERYGVENAHQRIDVIEKTKQTNLELYGNICTLQAGEIKAKAIKTLVEKFGAENVFASEYGKEKIKHTNMERYGVKNPQQNREIQKRTLSHYKYDNLNFDSSWELAVYIYCKDNNIPINRLPIRLEYYDSNNKKHYYFPDFLINDELIEIKGLQFLDEDRQLKDKDKRKCMADNNVIMWTVEEVQPHLNYCISKFHDKHWYKQFKIHK
jgi:hypothetical protein